jgi:hypothetical protein
LISGNCRNEIEHKNPQRKAEELLEEHPPAEKPYYPRLGFLLRTDWRHTTTNSDGHEVL